MSDNFSVPIVEAMKKYSSDGAIAFHTPGHKQGLGTHEVLKDFITAEGLRCEVSLMEELDDLHDPRTCIAAAEKLAAKLWNADEVLFSVNGTTSAIQTMILSTLKPGDLVFVPRNAHRSVMSGLILSGALPIYLPIEFSSTLKIPLNLTVETVQNAVKKFPQAKALIAVSPNYYGVSANLKKFSEILHAAGMLLLVDEAHGAHLQFSEKLPLSAMDSGADLSAQSTHKLLGSLTQTSMLLCRLGRIDFEKVRRSSSLLQSTSPNYLLLASLDAARLQMEEIGCKKISYAVELSEKLRTDSEKIDGLKTFHSVECFSFDSAKVTINVEDLGLTGIEAEKILRYDLKVQCELSDAANLLFLITYADNEEKISRLIDALKILAERPRKNFSVQFPPPLPNEISLSKISPRDAFYSESEFVTLENSVGKISAEEITFYPPGIPALNPGEIISPQIIEYILQTKKIGGRVIGASDSELNKIRVVKNFQRCVCSPSCGGV